MFLLRAKTIDDEIYQDVFIRNQYRLPLLFNDKDIIIDIGLHIGIFTYACLTRNAKKVIGFEPYKESYDLARINLADYSEKVELYNKAVWRSDVDQEYLLVNNPSNPAGCTVVNPYGEKIETVKLDSVLKRFNSVRFLKVDCENSEYPILFTSKELHRVKEIAIEAHNDGVNIPEGKIKGIEFNTDSLVKYLQEQDFSITDTVPVGDRGYYMIFAKR